MDTKICKKCKLEKDINQFYNRRENKDNKSTSCISCLYQAKVEYRQKNIEKIRQYNRSYGKAYTKNRRQKDPIYRMTCINRKLIYRAIKGHKSKRSTELLGCSIEELWKHLENQFTDGMTRENYGDWHIDHIIPLSSVKTIDEKEKLCHYSNLQPLWAIDNLKKGNKVHN